MTDRRDPFFRRVHPRLNFSDIGVVLGIANLWVLVVIVLAMEPTMIVVALGGGGVVGVFVLGLIFAARTFLEKRFEVIDEEMMAFLKASGPPVQGDE